MRFFGTARFPLLSVALVALVACGSIEEQCRNRHGASGVAYDQCLERQYRAIEDMTRHDTRSLPSFP